jgi:hypothetical protein
MKHSCIPGNSRSRRNFLRAASVTAATGLVLSSQMRTYAQQAVSTVAPASESDLGLGPNPTLDAALKFHPDGTPRPFAGNTVICHIPQQDRFRDDTAALHDALLQSSFAHKLALLPTESYHMTVYPGSNDQNRAHSSWPGGVPIGASIEECNLAMRERMKTFHFDGPFPLRVRVDVPRTTHYGRASTLRMEGADPASERILRVLRDRVADAYKFRAPDHDTYGFHITIAYTMADLSANEMAEYRSILMPALDRLTAATPVLELGIPEYCTFRDMYRFDTELILRAG